jgi:transposase
MDRAMYLVHRGASSAAAAAAANVTKSSVIRALRAVRVGRLVGQHGRPTFLDAEQEGALLDYVHRKHAALDSPSKTDLLRLVRISPSFRHF